MRIHEWHIIGNLFLGKEEIPKAIKLTKSGKKESEKLKKPFKLSFEILEVLTGSF